MTSKTIDETNLATGIRNLLTSVMNVKAGEALLVVSDDTAEPGMADRIRQVALGLTNAVSHLSTTRIEMGEDFPPEVAERLVGVDAVVWVTRFHPAVFRARAVWRAEFEYGVRMYHIDPPHKLGVATAGIVNSQIIAQIASRLERQFGESTELHISSPEGTSLVYRTTWERMNTHTDFPLRHSTFPLGIFVPHPVPGSVRGIAVFNAVDGIPGRLDEPISMEVLASEVVNIEGGRAADWLKDQMRSAVGANTLGEIGFGINPLVPLEQVLNTEWHEVANRAAGVVHAGIGGRFMEAAEFHRHLLMTRASVETDGGYVLIDSGRLAVLSDPELAPEIPDSEEMA